MPSIRNKITLGYAALAVGVGAFVLFVSVDLRFLEGRIREGVSIAAFQENAQEMRRSEKNYLLYRTRSDLVEARVLAERMLGQLQSEHAALAALAPAADLAQLSDSLQQYRQLLDQGLARPEAAGLDNPLKASLRARGHVISSQCERLAERERGVLVNTVRQSRYTLLWSVAVVALLAVAGGHQLYRVAVAPLRRLEEQLEPLAQGQFQAFSMVSRDREMVSFTQALNHMLEELALRRRQLLQSDKLASLGTLASGVAHELNNPLGNISGACQILLEELDGLPLDAEQASALREWLTQIDDETERARRIVRTLLDYSRRQPSEATLTPLAEIVGKSLLLMRQRLPGGVVLERDIAPELKVRADPPRLQQVFINLLSNALDAGSQRIELRARAVASRDWPPADAALVIGQVDDLPPAVLVSISDDGPGIPEDRIEHVFEPFYTTRSPGEGTGLGLYIVGEIIQEMGAGIAVALPPKGGTRFDLWLPDRGQA